MKVDFPWDIQQSITAAVENQSTDRVKMKTGVFSHSYSDRLFSVLPFPFSLPRFHWCSSARNYSASTGPHHFSTFLDRFWNFFSFSLLFSILFSLKQDLKISAVLNCFNVFVTHTISTSKRFLMEAAVIKFCLLV